MPPRPPLAGTAPGEFLARYWQQKPLLVRSAFPRWQNPLEPEELAGLALEPDLASRIVEGPLEGSHRPWRVRYGPFAEADFAALPESRWSLLVQEVNHCIPEVAELLAAFDFLPRWRLDDVMVSYAAEGGGVGPHTDSYDVFLIQGMGHRRWQVGAAGSATRLADGLDLQILTDFVPADDWVLEPGDMLYVPPGVPHLGVAVDGPCMTYSVGFRAPALTELLASVIEDAARHADPAARYADPGRTLPADSGMARPAHPGWIGPADLERVRTLLERTLLGPEAVARSFGSLMTERRRGGGPEPDATESGSGLSRVEAERVLRSGVTLVRNPATRWAWADPAGRPLLFADGRVWTLPTGALGLASLLASPQAEDGPANLIDREALRHFDRVPEAQQALLEMLQQGVLWPEGGLE